MSLSPQYNIEQTLHSQVTGSQIFLAEWWGAADTFILVKLRMENLCSNRPFCSMVKLTFVEANGAVLCALNLLDVVQFK